MSTAKNVLKYLPDPNKFDLRTHVWDSQGNLTEKNPYRAHFVQGRVVYERPVNSGNLWGENNKPCGRVELEFGENGAISKKEFVWDASHKDFKAPLTGAEKLHYELEQERERNQLLEQELAQYKNGGGRQSVQAVQEGFPAEDKKGKRG